MHVLPHQQSINNQLIYVSPTSCSHRLGWRMAARTLSVVSDSAQSNTRLFSVCATCILAQCRVGLRHSQTCYTEIGGHDYSFTCKSLTYISQIMCLMWMVLQQNMAAAQSLSLDANQIRPLCSPIQCTRCVVREHCGAHLQNLLQVLVYKMDHAFGLLNLPPGYWSTSWSQGS